MKFLLGALVSVVAAQMVPESVSKYSSFALGFTTGALVEYAAYYDDRPCVNDFAVIA